MLRNGTQMVLRMHIKSIKIRTWGIFCVKMVLEVIRDTFCDNFEIRFRAYLFFLFYIKVSLEAHSRKNHDISIVSLALRVSTEVAEAKPKATEVLA